MRSVFSLHAPFLSLCIALSIVPLISRALTEGDYTYTVTNGQATITGFTKSYTGALSITNVLGGYPVSSISSNAFYKCSKLTSVTIPSSVTAIGDSAFYYCYNVNSVTIPGSVTVIGKAAFSSIHGLTNLVVGTGVKYIGDYAFDYCSNLTSVNIPDSVTTIGNAAFNYCSGLTSVIIPASVTSIGNNAFYYCFRLQRILFQSTPPTLGGSSVFTSSPAILYYLPAFASTWPSSFGGRPTLCWNPTVQQDTTFGFASDRFGFNIAGTPDIPVKVEATTNLATGVWTPLTNATLGASGSIHFTDPSTNKPSCFYRIVWW